MVAKKAWTERCEKWMRWGLISDTEGAKLVDLEEMEVGKALSGKRSGNFFLCFPFHFLIPFLVPTLNRRDFHYLPYIGGAIERYEKYAFDKMIYVVSSQQDLHLSQFSKSSTHGFPLGKSLVHIKLGLVQGMSTRKARSLFRPDYQRGRKCDA